MYIEDPTTELEKIRHIWQEINIVPNGGTSIEPNSINPQITFLTICLQFYATASLEV
jgi:hypothetical protein